jgi:hypothetical protein
MLQAYRVFRKFISWLLGGLVLALAGEFAIDIAREHGFYDNPTERVAKIASLVETIKSEIWFWPAIFSLGGLVVGVWLDAMIRRPAVHATPGAQIETASAEEAQPADYAHGLALVQVQPSLDNKNAINTLEIRIVLRNASGLPLRYEVEKYEVIVEANVAKTDITTAVMPRDGVLTLFPRCGFSKKQYSEFKNRTTGTLEYQIKYGDPEKILTRRSYKLIHIDFFKKKGGLNINWIIANESDEEI